MTISAILILLVSTLFVVQNDYYNYVRERAQTQDAARSVSELVASEVRSIPAGAVLVADSTRMVVRKPLGVGVVCGFIGRDHAVHLPGGSAGVDTAAVSGFAVKDSTGSWVFTTASWPSIYEGTSAAATTCAGEGADTTDARDEFLRFDDLASMASDSTDLGDPVLLFRSLEITFATSALDSTTTALYIGTYGGTLEEFATGMAPDAHFSYRTGDTLHTVSVTGGDLAEIDGVRVHAWAEAAPTAARSTTEFDLTAEFRLRNVY